MCEIGRWSWWDGRGRYVRSEIVGLDWVDVRGVSGGCLLMLRGTKSGDDAPDHPIIRSLDPRACPVRALEAWRRRAERSGLVVAGPAPVFTSSGVRGGKLSPSRLASAWVGTILRKHAAAAGIPVEGWVAPLTGRRRLAAGPGRVFQRPAGACRGGRSADSVLLRPRRSRAAPTFPPPLLDHLCRVRLDRRLILWRQLLEQLPPRPVSHQLRARRAGVLSTRTAALPSSPPTAGAWPRRSSSSSSIFRASTRIRSRSSGV